MVVVVDLTVGMAMVMALHPLNPLLFLLSLLHTPPVRFAKNPVTLPYHVTIGLLIHINLDLLLHSVMDLLYPSTTLARLSFLLPLVIFLLKQILYISDITRNLLSIRQFCIDNYVLMSFTILISL